MTESQSLVQKLNGHFKEFAVKHAREHEARGSFHACADPYCPMPPREIDLAIPEHRALVLRDNPVVVAHS
jgi:hypothetical protein